MHHYPPAPPYSQCHAALSGPQCAAVQGYHANRDRCPDADACLLRVESWITQGMDAATYRGYLLARAIEAEVIAPPA